GRHDNRADGVGIRRELAASIAAEPPEPEAEDAEGGEREVVRGERPRRSVARVLAEPGADGDRAGEGHYAAYRVHDSAARAVAEAQAREKPAAPRPVADDRIDHRARDRGEHEERRE